MNLFSATQLMQYASWFLALLEFILACYVLLLNSKHIANRYTSFYLLITALDSFAMGGMLRAMDLTQAVWPSYILSVVSPLMPLVVLLTSTVLIKPVWLRECRSWIKGVFYGLGLVLPLLVIVDVNFGTRLWYVGLDTAYAGGYVSLGEYASGLLSPIIFRVYFHFVSLAALSFLIYMAVWDKAVGEEKRRLAWLLGGLQLFALIIQIGLNRVLSPPVRTLIAGGGIAIVYIHVVFHQMISERRLQRGRLQVRLTVMAVLITLPVFIAMSTFFVLQSQDKIEEGAVQRLQSTSRAVMGNTQLWLNFNSRVLWQLVNQPEIVSMDAAQQLAELAVLQKAYPHFYLLSTTDLQGMNVARSDGAPLKNYSDRYWFQGAREATADQQPIFQTLIGRTSGAPALVAALPIQDAAGQTIGVGMFASELTTVAQEVAAASWGDTGMAYVVDQDNQVVAHPALAPSDELRDLSATAPIQALRAGTVGRFSFVEDGTRWQAYLTELENGWGVVVQQQETEILKPLRHFQQVVWGATIIMAFLLAGLFFFAIRQAFMPIVELTEAATAIAAGDLTRMVVVESEDEFGILATAFNAMTERLRELVTGLERRVTARTRELERRTRYLEAAARVAHDAASVLEPERLLEAVVKLISERFGFYHAGIFLLDDEKEWAWLRAASSAGGRRMLSREHQLEVGAVGIVGHVAETGEPRVVLDVGADAAFFDNPDLPETRSEMALPLFARGEIIGVLDVQSKRPSAFSDEDVAVLQTLTDQVAVAIENTRLFSRLERSVATERAAYGEWSRRGWKEMFQRTADLGYICDARGARPLEVTSPVAEEEGLPLRQIPLTVRGQTVGTLQARKLADAGEWTSEEMALLESLTGQLDMALEGARLYEDSQHRAAQERLVGEVTARMRETLDMDTVLQTAIREIGETLNMTEVEVQMGTAEQEK
ncbi:MAG: GAF domain-containing protein [Chloroflexota bacterium]|nr:GAF domain-containing protein [Chloroflexota bacterium]